MLQSKTLLEQVMSFLHTACVCTCTVYVMLTQNRWKVITDQMMKLKLYANYLIKAKIYSATCTGKNKGFKEVWNECCLGANCTGFEKTG